MAPKQSYHRNTKRHDDPVKKVNVKVPYAKEYEITDISLHYKGPQEDEYFLQHQDVLPIIRRGNSEINGKVLRRGLQKFFDLKPNFFTDSKLSQSDQVLYDHILGNLTFPLRLIKMSKANGENCQITYFKDLDAYVVASKNVAIVVRDQKDLSYYEGDRYNFAKLIGETWFQIIKNKDQKRIKQLLENHTFIGEYCGNQKYQHLIKYWEIDLYFYAVVPKQGDLNCLLVEEGAKIFKELQLNMVEYKDYGVFSTKKEFLQTLEKISTEVTQNEIEKDQEGSVLYFETDRNIMLCKLKTLEYRLYRKLREKLKKAQYVPAQKLMQMYKNESRSLVGEMKTSKQLQYYFKIAEMAVDLAVQFKEEFLQQQLQGQFLNFLSIVIYAQANHKKPLKDDIFDYKLINEICKNTWTSYYKPLANLPQEIYQKQSVNTGVTILVPMSIPGCGKTYFKSYLQKNLPKSINFLQISSDQIRGSLISQLQQQLPKLSRDELFQRTTKSATSTFYNELHKLLNNAPENSLIFLDKNHPPNAIPLLQKNLEQYKNIQLIYLYERAPFSLETILFCLKRIQTREEHETLLPGEKSFEIFGSFVSMYKGWNGWDEDGISIKWGGKVGGQGLKEGLELAGKQRWRELCHWWDQYGKNLTWDEGGDEKLKDWMQQLLIKMGFNLEEETINNSTEFKQGEQKMEIELKEEKVKVKQDAQSQGWDMDMRKKGSNNQKQSENANQIQQQPKKQQGHDNKDKYQKLPTYIGLEIVSKIRNLAEMVILNNHIDIGQLDFQERFHITTLFLGNQKKMSESPIYQQFVENKLEKIQVQSLFVIRNMIAFFSVKPLQSLCANEFPHITMMVYAWKPRMSNTVLESMKYAFDQGVIKPEYQDKTHDVKIQGETYQIHILKCNETLDSVAKKFY